MGILGFIYWLNFRRPYPIVNQDTKNASFVIRKDRNELILLLGLLLIAYIFANHYNFKPLKMFKGTIDAYSEVASGRLVNGVAKYSETLKGGPMERDARITLINLISSNGPALKSLNEKMAGEILDYAIEVAEKNVSYNPFDSMMQMQLAQILNAAATYYYEDLDKFNHYSTRAMQAIDRSIEASPGRATIYYLKAQMQLVRNEKEEAIETLEYAISLNPNYSEGYCVLAQAYFSINQTGEYDESLEESFDNCFAKAVEKNNNISENLLKLGANHYSLKKDYLKAATISEHLVEVTEPGAEVWNNLARLYFVVGEIEKAEAAFNKAAILQPDLEETWISFKNYVQANPTEFK
jgi:tetratricopeptide (TPR) repeat protein